MKQVDNIMIPHTETSSYLLISLLFSFEKLFRDDYMICLLKGVCKPWN